MLIYHFVYPSFKFTFKIIVVLCLRPDHSIRCSFTNKMDTREPVGSMCHRSNSGSGVEDGPKFICCVDGQHTKIHEVWTFDEDGVTREAHTTARVDVGSGFVGEFFTNYLTPTWRRVPTSEEILLMEALSGSAFLT